MTSLASTLGHGAITAFNIAFTLLQIPIGVIGMPLGIVVLPSLSREAAVGRPDEFAALAVARRSGSLLFVMLPITGDRDRPPRTRSSELLFGYGRFDAAAVDLTAATLLHVPARPGRPRPDRRPRPGVLRPPGHPDAGRGRRSSRSSSTRRLAVVLAGPLGLPGLGLAIAIAAWLETVDPARAAPAAPARAGAPARRSSLGHPLARRRRSPARWRRPASLARPRPRRCGGDPAALG